MAQYFFVYSCFLLGSGCTSVVAPPLTFPVPYRNDRCAHAVSVPALHASSRRFNPLAVARGTPSRPSTSITPCWTHASLSPSEQARAQFLTRAAQPLSVSSFARNAHAIAAPRSHPFLPYSSARSVFLRFGLRNMRYASLPHASAVSGPVPSQIRW